MGFWDPDSDDRSDQPGRRTVLVICCPRCQHIEVERLRTANGMSYWHCPACQHEWKDGGDIGLKKARMP